jgi:membrane protease YdiL (CAAX protease family)
VDHRAAAIPARWWVVTAGLLATSLLANRLAPPAHLAIGLALALTLAVSAALAGLTPAELGLGAGRWRAGLRWGAVPVAVLVAAYAVALAVGPAREALADTTDRGWPAVALATLVVIPLGTVLPEELAFRGVLWALLCRRSGEWVATAGSSVLFGLWHVLPALGGGPANEVVVAAVGSGGTGTAIRVAGTVVFTAAAGVGLCWLRMRSGSLLAPTLLHWAVNGLGLLAVQLA